MLEPLLRGFAILATLLVVVGWGLFAVGEARDASDRTRTEIEGGRAARSADPSPEQERAREAANSDARELVDDANDVLLSPFAPVSEEASSRWVRRSVPAAIAVLVYGLGFGFLARFAGR
ncbi:MAG: hypothetical protein M3417_08315 [Actinomycetota bacterium]|nr:hypothetical protein [Actinomycetota bacterium]